jgi:hypothetical protein
VTATLPSRASATFALLLALLTRIPPGCMPFAMSSSAGDTRGTAVEHLRVLASDGASWPIIPTYLYDHPQPGDGVAAEPPTGSHRGWSQPFITDEYRRASWFWLSAHLPSSWGAMRGPGFRSSRHARRRAFPRSRGLLRKRRPRLRRKHRPRLRRKRRLRLRRKRRPRRRPPPRQQLRPPPRRRRPPQPRRRRPPKPPRRRPPRPKLPPRQRARSPRSPHRACQGHRPGSGGCWRSCCWQH